MDKAEIGQLIYRTTTAFQAGRSIKEMRSIFLKAGVPPREADYILNAAKELHHKEKRLRGWYELSLGLIGVAIGAAAAMSHIFLGLGLVGAFYAVAGLSKILFYRYRLE